MTVFQSSPSSSPTLSVVINAVDGGNVLRGCLDALRRQTNAPPMEVIVPCAPGDSPVAALSAEYPEARFLHFEAEGAALAESSDARVQHELFDRRRAAGLAAARGDLIAMLDDRSWPRSDWARTALRLHEAPHAAIGGAVECATTDLLGWAAYVCDFARYGLPFESGPRQWISDVNLAYKRRALDATRPLWSKRYREPEVHWWLLEHGETLFLSSELVVDHRRASVALPDLLAERFYWGRLFGHIRAAKLGWGRRLAYVVLGPLIPFLLVARHGRTQWRRGFLVRYLRALPGIALLVVTWTGGEMWGCLTNRP